MQIELSKGFREDVRRLSKSRRRAIARILDAVQSSFGMPHLHAGLGLRRLRNNYFECRVGLQLRIVFRAEPGMLGFMALGDHDEVRKLIRGL